MLVERRAQLAALEEHLAAAVAGAGRLVAVGGEAGVGKTSLVRSFADERKDVRVLWAACDGLFTPQPLAPVHDLGLSPDGPRREVFAATLDALSRGPTLVVVEDVHWADEATLDLLLYLARRLHRTKTLLVATYRDDEIGPDHPLRVVLGEVEEARRVTVRPLSVEGVRTLAAGSDVDPVELHRLTGGNAFFVTEARGRPSSRPSPSRAPSCGSSRRFSAQSRGPSRNASPPASCRPRTGALRSATSSRGRRWRSRSTPFGARSCTPVLLQHSVRRASRRGILTPWNPRVSC